MLRLAGLITILIACCIISCLPNSTPTKNELNTVSTGNSKQTIEEKVIQESFLIYHVNPRKTSLRLFWKNQYNEIIGSLVNLKRFVESNGDSLVFAMNGGMYLENQYPLGLFVDSGRIIRAVNTANASGNFYLKPNGIFYLDKKGNAGIVKTEDFHFNTSIQYATQSGPMLLVNKTIHPAFKKESKNINIRNGVGIKSNGELVFIITRVPINLYRFAALFHEEGCINALYLDGYVSRAYLPSKNWVQEDGNFGVMIGEVYHR